MPVPCGSGGGPARTPPCAESVTQMAVAPSEYRRLLKKAPTQLALLDDRRDSSATAGTAGRPTPMELASGRVLSELTKTR